MSDVFGPLGILAAFLILMGGLIAGLTQFDKMNTAAACRSFSQDSGYETKYAEYTFFSYDCLAKQSDGKWVSAYNLRGE